VHLGKRPFGPRQMQQAEVHDDRIERGVGERQLFGVTLPELDVRDQRRRPVDVRTVGIAEPETPSQTGGQQAGPNGLLRRVPHAEIGLEGQGRQQIGESQLGRNGRRDHDSVSAWLTRSMGGCTTDIGCRARLQQREWHSRATGATVRQPDAEVKQSRRRM
jgi:hypothetical protein